MPIIEKDICHLTTPSDKLFLKRSEEFVCSHHESSVSYITSSSGLSGKLSHRDHLQYFLFSGMIYMGLKKWEKALHCLSIVIAAPIKSSVSMIMVEAYKKWVLVSLLGRGMVSSGFHFFLHEYSGSHQISK
jgi:COP9 signalosome complex subunit 3